MIDLINKQVLHDVFGKGNVVKHNDSYIRICFKSGEKKFVFPDAFDKYLTLMDQGTANLIKEKIEIREKERNKEILKQKKERELEREQRSYLQRKRFAKNHDVYSRSQSVFWCKDDEKDRIFTDWSIFIGEIKSGQRKGQPRRLSRMGRNSACLLTARDSNTPEKDRYILGIFMVDRDFNGRDCKDGYIPAHPQYRIRLSEEESKKMLFWNYYINERYTHSIVWNSGRHRYFDNKCMAQILRDVISLKNNPKEKEYVKAFFKYFCYINNINENELPMPNGALIYA